MTHNHQTRYTVKCSEAQAIATAKRHGGHVTWSRVQPYYGHYRDVQDARKKRRVCNHIQPRRWRNTSTTVVLQVVGTDEIHQAIHADFMDKGWMYGRYEQPTVVAPVSNPLMPPVVKRLTGKERRIALNRAKKAAGGSEDE